MKYDAKYKKDMDPFSYKKYHLNYQKKKYLLKELYVILHKIICIT